MLQKSRYVFRVILSTGTHPPVPPIRIATREVLRKFYAVRHRIYKICKGHKSIDRISDTAYNFFRLKLSNERLISRMMSFYHPKPVVLYTFSFKTLYL